MFSYLSLAGTSATEHGTKHLTHPSPGNTTTQMETRQLPHLPPHLPLIRFPSTDHHSPEHKARTKYFPNTHTKKTQKRDDLRCEWHTEKKKKMVMTFDF